MCVERDEVSVGWTRCELQSDAADRKFVATNVQYRPARCSLKPDRFQADFEIADETIRVRIDKRQPRQLGFELWLFAWLVGAITDLQPEIELECDADWYINSG